MRAREAIEALAKHRGDAVAVCAVGMAANEWWAVTQGEDSFYMHGAMGFAASFALGLALSIPETPVWVAGDEVSFRCRVPARRCSTTSCRKSGHGGAGVSASWSSGRNGWPWFSRSRLNSTRSAVSFTVLGNRPSKCG